MASSGQAKGNDFLLYVSEDAGGSYTAVAHSSTCTLNVTNDMIDSTSKTSAGWAETTAGLRSWSMDVDGLYVFADTMAADDLFIFMRNRTKVMLKWATDDVADAFWTGYAYITSLSMDAPNEDNVTFSASFQGHGILSSHHIT